MENNKTTSKFNILFLIIVFIFNSSFSQDAYPIYIENHNILDSAYLEIKYEVRIIRDTSKITSSYEDVQVLQIGKNISKVFSYTNYQSDSIILAYLKQNKPTYPSKSLFSTTYEVYKKYITNTIDFIDIIYYEAISYEENIPKINWQIHNDKKMIAGYSCQKATGTFRGRQYEAWFTFDIPISDGPYKFTGLPGLILEIYDTQKHYTYKCIGVKPLNPMKPITIRDWKTITKINREKHNALYKRFCDNPYALEYSKGLTIVREIDGKPVVNPQNFTIPYNPIELE